MIVTGVRDLKNRLSHYLRLVGKGEIVLVTDRGTVVARLSPPGEVLAPPAGRSGEREALERLARTGKLEMGSGRIASATAPRPVDPGRGRRSDIDLERILEKVRGDRA